MILHLSHKKWHGFHNLITSSWERRKGCNMYSRNGDFWKGVENDGTSRYQEYMPGRGKAFTSFLKSAWMWHGAGTYLMERLHEITLPTLLINGEKDSAIPLAWAQKAHERMKNSQLAVLKDCGHWAQREMPEEFNQVVGKFLEQ